MVKQHCVLVQRWSPYFNPYENPLGRVATWVRIPDIPMHGYNKYFISWLGDRIGRTLKVDMNTLHDLHASNSKIERGKFVRLCVELDLQKKLVPKITSCGEVYNIEYEGLGLICFECGRHGHKRESCPVKCSRNETSGGPAPPQHTPQQPPPEGGRPSSHEEGDFGPWMIIQQPGKNRAAKW